MNSKIGLPMMLMASVALGGCHPGGGSGCLLCLPDVPEHIGGTVVGLHGVGLVLQDNGGDSLAVSSNGQFQFQKTVSSWSAYQVTVIGQPTNPIQNCAVVNGTGSGIVGQADITTVRVICANIGRFAYAADAGGSAIAAYTIDPVSGALTIVGAGPTPVPRNPSALAADPGGKLLYAVDTGGISAYSIDQTTGALSIVAGSPFATDAGPFTIVFHPTGRFAYTANTNSHSVSAYGVNGTTGALTPVAGSPFASGANPGSVVVDPSGRFLYAVDSNSVANSVWAYSINLTTGALTPIPGGPVTAGSAPSWVTVDPTGKFAYVANDVSNNVSAFTINSATGVLTAVTGSPYAAGSNPAAVAVDPSGTFLMVANSNGMGTPGASTVSVYEINPTTGELGPSGAYPADTLPNSVAVDPSGKFVYVTNGDPPANSISAFSLNANSGALAAIAGSPFPAGPNPRFITVTR